MGKYVHIFAQNGQNGFFTALYSALYPSNCGATAATNQHKQQG